MSKLADRLRIDLTAFQRKRLRSLSERNTKTPRNK